MNNNLKLNQQGGTAESVVTLMFPGNETLSETLSERTIGNRKNYRDDNANPINSPTDKDVDEYIRKIFLRSKSLPQEGGDFDGLTSTVNLSDFDIDGSDIRDTMTGGSSNNQTIRTFFLNNANTYSEDSDDIYLSDDADTYGDQFGGSTYNNDDEVNKEPLSDQIEQNIRRFFMSRH